MKSDITHLYWMWPLIIHGIIVTAFNTKRYFLNLTDKLDKSQTSVRPPGKVNYFG